MKRKTIYICTQGFSKVLNTCNQLVKSCEFETTNREKICGVSMPSSSNVEEALIQQLG